MSLAKIFIVVIIVIAAIIGGIYLVVKIINSDQNMTEQEQAEKLQIEDVKVGTGPAAQAGDTVSVHYTGTFPDGRKFDSSLDRGEPFSFTIGAGNVIQGWDEGVQGMQIGGTRKLIVPPSLGYGPNDHGPIPGNSTLHFTIELLEINPS